MFYQEWPLFTQPDINTWYLYACINSTLSQGCAVLKCSRKPILCYITQHVLKTSIQCLKTPDYLLRKIGVKIILRITPYICYFPCDIMTHPSPSDSNDLHPIPGYKKSHWNGVKYSIKTTLLLLLLWCCPQPTSFPRAGTSQAEFVYQELIYDLGQICQIKLILIMRSKP